MKFLILRSCLTFVRQCTWHKNHLSVHEFEKWSEKHRDSCEVNHKGSYGDIENEGAILIFGRSIELRYTEFVGDGDSSCFGKFQRQ